MNGYITFSKSDIHHVTNSTVMKNKSNAISIRETAATYAYPMRTATSPRASMVHDTIANKNDIKSIRIKTKYAKDISEISNLSDLLSSN